MMAGSGELLTLTGHRIVASTVNGVSSDSSSR